MDFNQARMESGQYLYDEKRYLEAIDQFRIAAFGFLNRPDWLSASLARLALAQTAASRPDDADATITRFVELQRRFPAYPPPDLEAERLAEFRALLLKRVQEATLRSVPSLSGLVESEEQKIARLAPAERRKALEAAARRDPSSVVWPVALGRECRGQRRLERSGTMGELGDFNSAGQSGRHCAPGEGSRRARASFRRRAPI